LKQLLGCGVILAFVGAGCGSGGQLGAKALLQQSMSLRSEAAEGAILAQDAVAGKTTRIYVGEHSADLYQASLEAETRLKAATTEPALGSRLRQLVALATQVVADLQRLGSASRGEDRALARHLQAAAQASERIGEGLS
jgi:hypothetical protein